MAGTIGTLFWGFMWFLAIWNAACMAVAFALAALDVCRRRWKVPKPEEIEAEIARRIRLSRTASAAYPTLVRDILDACKAGDIQKVRLLEGVSRILLSRWLEEQA